MSQPPASDPPEPPFPPSGPPSAPPGYMYVPVTSLQVNRFGLGKALSRGFGVFASNLPSFLPLALLCFLPLTVFLIAMGNPVEKAVDLDDLQRKLWLFSAASFLGGLLTQQILAAALTFAVVESSAGRRAPFGRILVIGLSRALPAVGVSLLVFLCMIGIAVLPGIVVGLLVPAVGVLVIIVLGLIVYCTFFVAVPSSVIERNGAGALGRSADLTRGFRWQIFVILLVWLGCMILIGLVPALFVETQSVGFHQIVLPDDWALYTAANLATQAIAAALSATFAAVVYVGRRTEKDGVPIDDLARVFD